MSVRPLELAGLKRVLESNVPSGVGPTVAPSWP